MNCLARHDKSLLFPPIVYAELDAGGCYYQPGRYEIEIDGKFYDGKRGIIVVNPEYPELIDGVIAHEWRHHWQRFNLLSSPEFPYWPWSPSDDYEASIRNYFRAWWEYDALMFEYKYARNESNDSWVGMLHGNV